MSSVFGQKSTETLEAINSLQNKLGVPPTLRELQEELGLNSNNPVLIRLKKLEREGFISKERKARSIRITHKGVNLLSKHAKYNFQLRNMPNWRQSWANLQFQTSGTVEPRNNYSKAIPGTVRLFNRGSKR